MSKRTIGCVLAAALLGGGLVWAADHRADGGIAGWETLNAGMAQALGVTENGGEVSGAAVAAGGVVSGAAAAGDGTGSDAPEGTAGSAGAVAAGVADGSTGTGGTVSGGATAGSAGSRTAGTAGGGTGSSGELTGGAAAGSDAPEGTAGSTGAVAAGVADGSTGTGGTVSGGITVYSAAPAVAADGRINVNAADAQALMDLPGIGEKKAQAIIDYRSSKGAFRSLSDLGKVKGIGPKLLEQLKQLVVF